MPGRSAVFAGYSQNADWNIGRLLDAIEEMGNLDNTLIFYIWGDNGSSMEGTVTGSFNEMTFLNALVLEPEQQLRLIDQYGGIEALGGDHTAPHYAAAWAHAGNSPFQWGKQLSSHLGGTRNPMVVAWPERINPGPEPRTQFTHCIDVVPTILEAIGLPEPVTVDGIGQEPMDGTSFLDTFGDAQAAERHTVQYFEMFGSRAMYSDSWWACAKLDRAPWDFSPQTLRRFAPGAYDPEQDVWELYYLPDDFSQAHDLAAQHPDKLAELKELWWAEAERNRGAAAARRDERAVRHPAAAADGDPVHLRRGRAERAARHGAPDPRAVLRHRGRADRARRRCGGRHRGQCRLHRRVRAVGR